MKTNLPANLLTRMFRLEMATDRQGRARTPLRAAEPPRRAAECAPYHKREIFGLSCRLSRLAPLLLGLALALGGWGGAYAGTYDEWVQVHNLPSATSGPADAPAGDGIANLLKFALGLEPLTPGPRPLF